MDMSGLSQEQLRSFTALANTIKDLPDRQLEILEKVLASETDVGKLRISYLKEYFDIYSRNLDAIARRQSELNDAYLILNKKAAENSKLNNFGGNGGSGGSGGDSGSGSSGGPSDDDIAELKKKSDSVKNFIDEETRAKLDAEEEVTEEKQSQAKKLSDFIEKQTRLARLNQEEFDNEIAKTKSQNDIYEAKRFADRQLRQQQLANKEKALTQEIIALNNLRHQDEIDKADQITAIRLTKLQEVTNAEIGAQKLVNSIEAELAYAGQENYVVDGNDTGINEAGALMAKESSATDRLKMAQEMEDDIAKYRAKRELELKRKNNGILSKEDATRIQKEIADKFKLESLNDEKLIAKRAKLEAGQALKKELKDGLDTLRNGETFEERKEAFKNLTHDANGDFNAGKAISAAIYAVSDLAKQLEAKIDSIAGYKGAIDTRLQGSGNERFAGSYWDQLVRDMTSVGAVNPFFKQETFANNIQSLVNKGISFDLKQRAFLMTIQDKIANTFDVADGTLLRLVRIQQQDSTAGRLGMESALNSFLNEMYETSEYLTDVAKGVRSSLEEMQALMEGAEATEVEYQVQKWLGSLYSVGMSQSAVQGISDALGKIAAGQIEGLTNGGAGNLLIMAANDAGLSIADVLTGGLNSADTNKLLQAAVNYLAELSDSAKDNKVVQQQLADVFGVKASDLRAATNLVLPGTTNDIFGNNMTYGNMISQLSKMAGSMGSRTSMAEMMTNFWENGQYTLAGSMASNPVSYFIYKMAKVVDDAAGGIDLPFLNVMGFGVDLNTTVSDLMRVAAVGTGILGSLGPLVSGLGSSFSGRAMLNKLGIGNGSGLAAVTRGGSGGGAIGAAGGTVSESGSFAGNSSGSDVKDSTIQESEDSKKQQMIEAKEEEEANKVDVLNQTVLQIYELLNDIANGDKSFKVKVEGYGLTKAGSSGNGALGGVGGAANNSGIGGTSGGSTGSSGGGSLGGGSVNGGGVGGSIDLGGWTMT